MGEGVRDGVTYEADPALLGLVKRLGIAHGLNVVWRKGAAAKPESSGKNPYQGPHQNRTAEQVATLLTKRPQDFGAVSIMCGPTTGIAILDIDMASAFERFESEYGYERQKPYVTSTKPSRSCFKALFRVPEEFWAELNDVNEGDFQILWQGHIGVIAGVYPGSSCGAYRAGQYRLHGTLEEVPVAPDWMLQLMRGRRSSRSTFAKALSAALTRHVDAQTDEEAAEFIRRQLQYIPAHGGLGLVDEEEGAAGAPRKAWLRVGMAIHQRLQGPEGLGLWVEWSKRDPDYAEEWATGRALSYIERQWATFRTDGGRKGAVTPGTLFWLAEQHDPERKRFPEVEREAMAQLVETAKADVTALEYNKLVCELERIDERHWDNPGLIAYARQKLSALYSFRSVNDMLNVYAQHQQKLLAKRTGINSMSDLLNMAKRDWLVPGLIQSSGVYILAGDPSAGKTSFCAALAKYVIHGTPLEVLGKQRPIEKGGVLWLSSDTGLQDFRETLMKAGLVGGDEEGYSDNTEGRLSWNLGFMWTEMSWLRKRIEGLRPRLVIIDSLASCNRNTGVDENSSAVANPIYELQLSILSEFPEVTVIVLHHLKKDGSKMRGSTAIEGAATTVWMMTKPTPKQCEENQLDPARDRVIVPGSKNRSGVHQSLICHLDKALDTLKIREFYTQEAKAFRDDAFHAAVKWVETFGASRTEQIIEGLTCDGFTAQTVRRNLLKAVEAGLLSRRKGEPGSKGGQQPWIYEGTGKPGTFIKARAESAPSRIGGERE